MMNNSLYTYQTLITMKKIILSIHLLMAAVAAGAQDDIYPAKPYSGKIYITNGTLHIGNGQVIENGTIEIENGKIKQIGQNMVVPAGDVKLVNAQGKQVYPGLILPVTDLGLKEIANGVRGSNDYRELGEFNPGVRALSAYNAASKITGTLRSNGILLAGVTPQGGIISGSSSVVQLDAWNYEDAAYKAENAIHLQMPGFIARPARGNAVGRDNQQDAAKQALEAIERIKVYFREAKAYVAEKTHKEVNINLEALRPLFDKKQKLIIHADQVKQMMVAIDFVKEFGFDVVIAGGSESWQIAGLLQRNNIAVILNDLHALPATEDDDVDQPFKTPAMLQQAGVLFALNDEHGESRYRNLAYNAGTAAAYGLTKEQALQAITLNAAKILGVEERSGSLEAGKDANIVVCDGDILDMKSSQVIRAFIQGRDINLQNKQTQLYERYKYKYGL